MSASFAKHRVPIARTCLNQKKNHQKGENETRAHARNNSPLLHAPLARSRFGHRTLALVESGAHPPPPPRFSAHSPMPNQRAHALGGRTSIAAARMTSSVASARRQRGVSAPYAADALLGVSPRHTAAAPFPDSRSRSRSHTARGSKRSPGASRDRGPSASPLLSFQVRKPRPRKIRHTRHAGDHSYLPRRGRPARTHPTRRGHGGIPALRDGGATRPPRSRRAGVPAGHHNGVRAVRAALDDRGGPVGRPPCTWSEARTWIDNSQSRIYYRHLLRTPVSRYPSGGRHAAAALAAPQARARAPAFAHQRTPHSCAHTRQGPCRDLRASQSPLYEKKEKTVSRRNLLQHLCVRIRLSCAAARSGARWRARPKRRTPRAEAQQGRPKKRVENYRFWLVLLRPHGVFAHVASTITPRIVSAE